MVPFIRNAHKKSLEVVMDICLVRELTKAQWFLLELNQDECHGESTITS